METLATARLFKNMKPWWLVHYMEDRKLMVEELDAFGNTGKKAWELSWPDWFNITQKEAYCFVWEYNTPAWMGTNQALLAKDKTFGAYTVFLKNPSSAAGFSPVFTPNRMEDAKTIMDMVALYDKMQTPFGNAFFRFLREQKIKHSLKLPFWQKYNLGRPNRMMNNSGYFELAKFEIGESVKARFEAAPFRVAVHLSPDRGIFRFIESFLLG